MFKLSEDQESAINRLKSWWKEKKGFMTLGGYAGTGKTTIIAQFKQELDAGEKKTKVAFISFTGKAATILKSRLLAFNAIKSSDFVGTIHSLIYSPLLSPNDEIVGWQLKDQLEYDLIIVDEASMVDSKVWQDLVSFNIPILAVGDHGQLPPIQGSFNLMAAPQIILEKIHRQAEGDPIINIASMARMEGFIPVNEYSDKVKKLSRTDPSTREEVSDLLSFVDSNTLILCGYNTTRVKLNKHVRNSLERESDLPVSGDKVICLRNNHEKNIYNGMIGYISKIEPENEKWSFAEIGFEDDQLLYKGLIFMPQFNNISGTMSYTDLRKETLRGDLFDYGYAMTVHKSQGSQASKVILFEERFKQMDDEMWRRWLYTAVTRAQNELIIIGQ